VDPERGVTEQVHKVHERRGAVQTLRLRLHCACARARSNGTGSTDRMPIANLLDRLVTGEEMGCMSEWSGHEGGGPGQGEGVDP
jgi:hypothetical protein